MDEELQPSEKTAKFFNDLRIPTHPDYSFEHDSGDLDYAPPVQLNNRLLLYTNAVIELTTKLVTLNQAIEADKLMLHSKQRELEGLKRRLLSKYPASPSAAKNLMLTEAYVLSLVERDGKGRQYDELVGTIATIEDRIEGRKGAVSNLNKTFDSIQLASENIRYHLSYVKEEQRRLGYGA